MACLKAKPRSYINLHLATTDIYHVDFIHLVSSKEGIIIILILTFDQIF